MFLFLLLSHSYITLLLLFETHLGHLHRVGQHLLQSTDRQGLLQNEGAYGQIRGHILKTHKQYRFIKKLTKKPTYMLQRTKKGGAASASCLSIGCGFQEAETVPEALAGQTQLNLLLQDGGSALQNHLVILWPKHTQTLRDTLFPWSFIFIDFQYLLYFFSKSYIFLLS